MEETGIVCERIGPSLLPSGNSKDCRGQAKRYVVESHVLGNPYWTCIACTHHRPPKPMIREVSLEEFERYRQEEKARKVLEE